MKVSEIMEKEFITVKSDMDVLGLAKLLMGKDRDSALVLNDAGELVGIVTETDLIFQEKRLHIPTIFTLLDTPIFLGDTSKFNEEMKKMSAVIVRDIMTAKMTTISSSASVSDAATIMIEKDIHHLPVVENKKPVGVVTKEALLQAFIKEREK